MTKGDVWKKPSTQQVLKHVSSSPRTSLGQGGYSCLDVMLSTDVATKRHLYSNLPFIASFQEYILSTYSPFTSSNQWSQHQMTTWPARDVTGDSGQVSNRECWVLQKNFNMCILSKTKQGIWDATICHCLHYFFIIPEETLSLNFHPKYQ